MSHDKSKWGDILSKIYYAMAIIAMLISVYKYFYPTKPKITVSPSQKQKPKPANSPTASPLAKVPVATPTRQSFEPKMVFVQGGTFQMGSNDDENEKPIHSVTLSDYSIGKYELTVGEFRTFIFETSYETDTEKEGYSYVYEKPGWESKKWVTWECDIVGNVRPSSEENHPVIYVSWNDAVAYCKWLSQKTGNRYGLPTEAQWEYAARGGKNSKGNKYSGSNDANRVAWYDSKSGNKTHPVGGKSANELGIYDMSGNVWEWCSDWYGNYSSSTVSNPIGAVTGTGRVSRGGSWFYSSKYCRVVNRDGYEPSYRHSNYGFRVVSFP